MADTSRVGAGRAGEAGAPLFAVGRPDLVLVLTAFAAGAVDAISYVGLGHVFTANMTGNTVLLGLALGQVQGLASVRSLAALAGFALGVMAGALLVEGIAEPGARARAIRRAVALEGGILAALALAWFAAGAQPAGGGLYGLITLAALAMGIQSAAVRRIGVAGVATTYITGTLTSLCAGLVARTRAVRLPPHPDRAAPPPGDAAKAVATSHQDLHLPAAVLVTYGLGAVASGVVLEHWPSCAALPPFVAVALALAEASLRPSAR